MNTKGHCYPKSIILYSVYLKLRFTLNYRDVEEIMKMYGYNQLQENYFIIDIVIIFLYFKQKNMH